jgi:5-methylcytosine-specific restriction protein A
MGQAPSWVRDELILVLDLYFQHGKELISPDDEAVEELGTLLRSLPLHPESEKGDQFRSNHAVVMKVQQFAGLDSDTPYKGRGRVGQRQREIWDTFGDKSQEVRRIAQKIQEEYEEIGSSDSPEEQMKDEEFREGRILTRVHKRRERDPRLTRRKKQKVRDETGQLACEVCGFDFAEFYGKLGEGFAECHHRTPLAEIEAPKETALSDLAIVCSNCHSMIHRGESITTVEQLRQRIDGQRTAT